MNRILGSALISGVAFLGMGCAHNNLSQKVEQLTREKEDLMRQNTQLRTELAECEAKRTTMEQERQNRPMKTQERSNEYQLPDDLKSAGVNLKRRGRDTVIEIPSDLFFPSGVSKLSGNGDKTLRRLAEIVKKRYPQAFIRIEGHTDSDPIRRTKSVYHCNWDLSFERAHSVLHFLIQKCGLDARRVACDSYAQYQPEDARNKARNRRVELVISPLR